MATLTTAQIQQAYVTFFSRPADPVGLAYWQSYTGSIADLYATFAQQTEYSAAFSGLTSAQKVNVVYQNLFGRDAEQSGLLYWAARVESGAISVANLALAVSAGSQGTDSVVVSSRVTAATAFTAALDTSAEILGYSGASANAVAKTWLSAVKTAADLATAVAAVDAAVTSVSGAGGAAGVPGSTFTLTTSVDGVSGTANDDTITGLVGASGSYGAGDNINGGAGTDTLNLVFSSGDSAGGLVQLVNVENVNVRQLGTAATAVTLNANDWTGVTTLTNASSLATSILQVSGLATTTKVSLLGDTDINVAFVNTTTATDAVSVALTSAGSFGTSSVHTLAGTGGLSTAELDLDLANAGLLTKVNVEVNGGANLARLEAGSNVTTYTLTGAGSAVLVTDDTITSFNAAALTGGVDVSFSGASDVVAVGGAGNDTFRFGATYTNNDSVNGGAGTDTVAATFAGFNRNLTTTAVEVASLTFNDDAGGTVNATASTVATYNLIAGSAGADANVAGVADASVINIASNNLDDVSVGFNSASTGIVNLGSASGTVGIDAFGVSGVSTLTVNANGGTGGAGSFGVATFGGVKTLNITTVGAESDVTFTDVVANAATAVTITSNGSAAITLTSGLEAATALTVLTISANGSDAADIALGTLSSATADKLTTISLSGASGADVTVGAVKLGNGATAGAAGTITLTAGNGSIVGTSAADVTTTGAYALTLNLNALASGAVALGDIVMGAGTAATAASAAISLTVAPVTVAAAGLVTVEKVLFDTAAASLNIGAVTVGTSAGFSFGATGIVGSADAASFKVSDITVNLAADASATFGTILATAGSVGNIALTIADSASASLGVVNASSIGAITITAVGDGEGDIAGLTAVSNIGAITLSLADEADATIAAIVAGGDMDNITIGNGASSTANFSTIGASSIGNITVSGAGFVDFGTLSATRIGTVDVTQMTSGTFNIDLSAVTNAAEVKLGAATNTVISGVGNDVITLKAGVTANDIIKFGTATQGTDNLINFGAGTTGGDIIAFATGFAGASGGIIMGSARATDATTVGLTIASTASGAITIADTISVVVVNATAFASTAAMVSAIASGGSLEIGAGTAATAGSLVIAWTDGTDTYISLVGVTAASGTNALIENGSALATVAVIQGVTPGALVAANFDFV